MTGHQGEPRATLSKIAADQLDFSLEPGDHVVFSCTVIPTETNRKNRKELESRLKAKKVRIFKDIHVSGHAAREDLRDLISFLKPKKIIPAHGTLEMRTSLMDLALDMDYKQEDIIMLNDGERTDL